MSVVSRYDAIRLNPGTKAPAFERFMLKRLFPVFRDAYAGPTRATLAHLTSQALLKDTARRGAYLWKTDWEGDGSRVLGASFEFALVGGLRPSVKAKLKELSAFGKRTIARVYVEAT